VKWKVSEVSGEMDTPKQFVVYLNEAGKTFDPEKSENILAVVKGNKYKFSRMNKKKKKYEVRVSVLNRLHNESETSGPLIVKL